MDRQNQNSAMFRICLVSSGKSPRDCVAIQSHRPHFRHILLPLTRYSARCGLVVVTWASSIITTDCRPLPRLRSASRWMVFIRPMKAMDRMSRVSTSLASLPKSTMVTSTSGQGFPGRLNIRLLWPSRKSFALACRIRRVSAPGPSTAPSNPLGVRPPAYRPRVSTKSATEAWGSPRSRAARAASMRAART